MRYLDALTEGFFKTDADGRPLFYPWQGLGPGYLIPSQERAEQLRLWINGALVVSLVVAVLAMAIAGLASIVGVAAATVLAYYGWTQVGLTDLQPTAESKVQQQASTTPQTSLIGGVTDESLFRIGALGCGAFVLIGLFMLLSNPVERFGQSFLLILVFGAGAAGCVHQLKQRSR